MKSDLPYLKHILDAALRIREFTEGMNLEQFLEDSKTQSAVVRELEVIGEATKGLSRDFREEHPKIPWAAVAGTRDRLIHGYFDVDLHQVWQTTKSDLPQLKETVKKAIAELEG
jgi:uncharacterized protein with HEPN domain